MLQYHRGFVSIGQKEARYDPIRLRYMCSWVGHRTVLIASFQVEQFGIDWQLYFLFTRGRFDLSEDADRPDSSQLLQSTLEGTFKNEQHEEYDA